MTRSLQKGVTLNDGAFCGFCEAFFRDGSSGLVETHGALPFFSKDTRPAMSERTRQRLLEARIYVLVVVVSAATLCLLLLREWYVATPFPSEFWNAVGAFVILGIVSDSFSFTIPFARVSTSVSFIPILASIPLFPHPWPMVIGGITGLIVERFVRNKPPLRVWFNTAQYMLAAGLGALVYSDLGGSVGLDAFNFNLIPFVGLVVVYFVANKGSVALAVSFSSGVSVREAWDRIGKDSLVTDLLSSTLAILLVFLYIKLHLLGLVILVFPLFLVRQLYQMNLQLQEELEEKLELMVKAMEARDPYTSGHSRRVSEYALAIARELKLPSTELDSIKRAALLHDVGKIYEEFAPLLRKEGKLTPEERMTMQSHVIRSADLVATAARLRGAVQAMIRHHHENYDGSGYPDGLVAESIPAGARIIMIADTLDAMTSDRPYRKALTLNRAIEELQQYAGKQFDPALVDVVANSAGIRRLLGPGPGGRPEAALVPKVSGRKPAWAERVAQ